MNWGGGGSGVALLTQPLSPRLFNMLKIPLQEIYFWETKVSQIGWCLEVGHLKIFSIIVG